MDSVHVTRRGFLQTSAAALLLAGGTSAAPEKRRNVLFIAVDDLNHSLGCYGHRVARTPNIDRLAASGMRFDRAYCQYPVCNPSRSSLLSGLRPDSTGIFNNTTPFRSRLPDIVTLPQLFREAGYFTARLGKIFHSAGEFDDPKAWDTMSDPRATAIGRKGQGRNLTGGQVKWCNWLAAEGEDEDQPDGQIASEAIRLLEQSFGDHGYHLGEQGWWNKNTLYEHSARAPLLIAAPDETVPGTTCGRFVEFIDFYPTLVDLCGLAAPAGLEGRSFRPLLRQPDLKWKEAAFTQVQRSVVMGRTVRTDRWRYTEWDDGKLGVELYDHQ